MTSTTKTHLPNTNVNILSQLDTLSAEREKWENGAYKTSNEQLYGILASCLDIYQQLNGTHPAQMKLRKELNNKLTDQRINFNQSTNLATKIVRLVFRTDRKRASVYARVIMSAHDAHIDSLGLPKWIRDEGGIDEVRRSHKGPKPAEVKQSYADVAAARLSTAKALVAPFKGIAALKASSEGTSVFSVALIRNDPDGNISVVYGDNSPKLVNEFLAKAGRELEEQSKEYEKLANDSYRKAMRAKAISVTA